MCLDQGWRKDEANEARFPVPALWCPRFFDLNETNI